MRVDEDNKSYSDIGNVAVVLEGTENPYGRGIVGTERSRVLGRFLRGYRVEGYELWYAPCSGGAKKLKTPEECNVDPEVVDYLWDEKGEMKRR